MNKALKMKELQMVISKPRPGLTKLVISQPLDSFQVPNDGNVGINSKYKKLPRVELDLVVSRTRVMQRWQHWQ